MFLPSFLVPTMLHALMRDVANKREPDQVIPTHDGRPYLRRWHITPKGDGPACYLHHFLASDDDRALHDHPWASVGILLSGEYREHVRTAGFDSVLHRRAGDVVYRGPHWTHRVELLRHPETGAELEVWTLFLVGDRVRPRWPQRGVRLMNPWDMSAEEAKAYAAGLRHAASTLAACTDRLGDALGVEGYALTELRLSWDREAVLIEGCAQNALDEDEAAEEDPDALAAAVAEDLHNQVPAPARGTAAAQSEDRPASPGGVEGPATSPVWTEDRLALLTMLYPTRISLADILARLNALPGPQIASTKAVANQGYRAGLSREGKPAPTQPPPLDEDIAEAKERIREGQRARWIADEYGWPLKFAQELCAEADAEAKAA